jgi:hypothetical protein
MMSTCGETVTLLGRPFRIVEVSVTTTSMGELDYVDLKLIGDASFRSPWNDCDDTLPPDDTPVLCARDSLVREAVYWGPEDGWSISPEPEYWMPMPEGP